MKRRMPVKLVAKAADLTFQYVLYRPMEWLVRRYSSVGRHQFFDPSQFPWIPRIEAGWTAIRDEMGVSSRSDVYALMKCVSRCTMILSSAGVKICVPLPKSSHW